MLQPDVPGGRFGDIDGARWDQIEPPARELLRRPVHTPPDFERWLLDRSELEAACSEARASLYITMSCNTEDRAANDAYARYIETIPPRLKPLQFALDKRHVELSGRLSLDPARYTVLDRSKRAAVALFREENVPIQTELARLVQEYDRIAGAQTVVFDGREHTLPQVARNLEETGRDLRERAWRAMAECRLRDRAALDTVLDRMVVLRDRMARNAGHDDFLAYTFVAKERFDYAPADCRRFWDAVERRVVPFLRRLDARRRERLGVEPLRPWDLNADDLGRPPLRPFTGGRDLFAKAVRVFEKLDPRLAEMAAALGAGAEGGDGPIRSQCLDLDSRKGKRPGGYQYMRDRSRLPFIFMNAAGLQRDVMTMLHELGHAFHSTLCRHEPLVDYRHTTMEFAEVASMSMEHLTMPHWNGEGGFYPTPQDHARALRAHLEDSLSILAWIAAIDSFQTWMYTSPAHSRQQRDARWIEIDRRFGHAVSWDGLEHVRAAWWQKQSHIFSHPLYYIEYGIAQLGALQLWLAGKTQGPRAAVDAYIRALTLGGSATLPRLFEAAGLRLDFGDTTLARAVDAVEAELEHLAE